MFKLTFSDIRKNLKLFFGTFIAIMVASAIITACLNLVFSATANFSSGHRFNGVDLVLIANQQISLKTVDEDGDIEVESKDVKGRIAISDDLIKNLKSKYNIIEDYTFYIEVSNLTSKKLAGHNISSLGLTGFTLSGNEPSVGQVVIDENLAEMNNLKIGDTTQIYSSSGVSDYEISGIVYGTGAEDYKLQNYMFFSDEVAKANAKGCQSVAIIDDNVSPDDFSQDEYTVFAGDDTNKAEQNSIVSNDMSVMVIFITMGSVCLVISLFVISGTMQFSIKNRYRLLAQLRVIGLKKSQISAMLSWQTVIISLLGAGFGAVLSIFLAKLITALYFDMGIVSADFIVTFSPFWATVVILAITLLSVLVTNVTAAKPLSMSPATAIKSEGDLLGKTSPIVAIFGIVFVLGGVAILLFTPMTQGVGIGMVFCASTVLLGGAICLMPLIVRFFNVILSVTTKRASKSLGQVAYGNIKMKASKFAVACVSIAIMMSMGSVMVLSNEVYITTSVTQQYEFADDYAYVSGGKFQYQTEGTGDIFAVKNTNFVLSRGDKLNDYNVLAVLGDTPKLDFIEKADDISGGDVWVSENVKGVRVGDELSVYLENGENTLLTVGGIFSSQGISDENYSFVVDYDFIKHSIYNEKLSTVYSQDVLFADSNPNTPQYYETSVSYDIQYAASLLLGMIGLVLSVVALFNTFFVIMSVRRGEFNRLKLIGAKKGQLLKMTFTEVIVVTLTGMVIGTAVIASCVGMYSLANAGVFSFIVNPTIFWGMIILAAALSITAGILPSFITIAGLKRQFRNE